MQGFLFFFKMDGYPQHWMFDSHQEECMTVTLVELEGLPRGTREGDRSAARQYNSFFIKQTICKHTRIHISICLELYDMEGCRGGCWQGFPEWAR